MNSFRQINKHTLLLWSLLACLALLSVQGVKLHAHNLDHKPSGLFPDYSFHVIVGHVANEADYHQDFLAHHMSHDHHDNGVSEIDISPDGLLKSSNNSTYSLELFAMFFVLMALFVPQQQLVQRCRKRKLAFHRFYAVSPPLRAPPQH